MHNYKDISILSIILLISFSCSQSPKIPPFTDYNAMLSRDIAGKKHGFLAGNLMNYIGGSANAEYEITEFETIGFTHPLFDDTRSRGQGIVTNENGTGHDFGGWDFWRNERIAYGTVLVDGIEYVNPAPKEMIWRPDRQVCQYEVGDALIEETKFISENDVLVAIIKSSEPVVLRFGGKSFFIEDTVPEYFLNPPGTPFMTKTEAQASYDQTSNCLQVLEKGGVVMTRIDHNANGKPAVQGRFVYDGMSKVLSCSKPFGETVVIRSAANGQQEYQFSVPCDENGIVLTFSMDDDYHNAVLRTKKVLSDPVAALNSKSAFMNNLLNYQIPYFRCSDSMVEQTYYYLWALYFMYFRDVGKGFTPYPYTVTAVNNFRTLFSLDAYTYIQQAAWVVDKVKWGYGNILNWQYMLPFKNGPQVPETFGSDWWSPIVGGNITHYPEATWMIYQHSGDKEFLWDTYDFFRNLWWDEGLRDWAGGEGSAFFEWGIGLNICRTLINMAEELKLDYDIKHWENLYSQLIPKFEQMWEQDIPDFMGPSKIKDIPALWTMMTHDMPDDWAEKMSNRWVMNSEEGFLGEVPINIRAKDSEQVWPFNVSTLTTWLAVEGMFRHHVDTDAIKCTLGHINGMVRDYGFPITPEAWDGEYKPWGSQYYGWDEAMVLLLIERLAGISYSMLDSTFTVSEHLPESWDFVETMVPVVKDQATHWIRVKTERTQKNNEIIKTITVNGNIQNNLIIEPWLERKFLVSSVSPRQQDDHPKGHVKYKFTDRIDATVTMVLQ